MKSFILRLASVLAPVCLIILAINAIYLSANKKNDADGLSAFRSIPDSITLCSFGSSHAYNGYDFSVAEDSNTYMNFGLPSQSLSYDERILDCYKDRLQPGATVFITVSYHSLFGNSETEQGQFESKNRRYYTFLPREYIKEYDPYTAFFMKYFPALIAEDSLFDVFVKNNEGNQVASKSSAEDIARAAYKRHILTEKVDESGEWIVNDEEVSALYRMIDICKDKGATPILVTTPLLSEYTGVIETESPRFYEFFYELIDEVKKSAGVEYWDFSHDERFCNEYELFVNPDHLNKQGAKIFTRILLDEVITN